jgi:hypothetical protein
MSAKKPAPKKALAYTRPQPGTFTLNKFPGVDFRFRMISIDDEAWCLENLGNTPGTIISSKTATSAELCRLYFHFLEDDCKARFIPEEAESINYDTGKKETVVVPGYRLFMKSIDGGSLTEILLIARAFLKTLLASRPISDLPDEVKKNLMAQIESRQTGPETPAAQPAAPATDPPSP